ncbi:hypothetical protein Vadar_021163 [Vaccinium darrowii]|uniref:Uncharacterized protein n=1 Tax=Vaccinium darrowii TaxID=229202 RepID=A0ACB7Y1C6_9ERIC|nr:hypothetical protein Vadar_021163 [Vaccinium darrowii]
MGPSSSSLKLSSSSHILESTMPMIILSSNLVSSQRPLSTLRFRKPCDQVVWRWMVAWSLMTTVTPSMLANIISFYLNQQCCKASQGLVGMRFDDNIFIHIVDSGIWPEDESFRDEELGSVPSGWKGNCIDAPNFNSRCSNSDILATMESAIQDDIPILSLSLGGTEYPYHDAARNHGPDSYSLTDTATWLTTVSVGSIDRAFKVNVLLRDCETFVDSSLYSSSAINICFSTVDVGLCDTSNGTSYDLTKKIVVINVASSPSFDFAQLVKKASGVGVIQINSVNVGETLLAISFPLPAASRLQ